MSIQREFSALIVEDGKESSITNLHSETHSRISEIPA
jgi:hypothetical protein